MPPTSKPSRPPKRSLRLSQATTRSPPVCSVSFANASACNTPCLSSESDAMDVDPRTFSSKPDVPVPPLTAHAVPFPSHPQPFPSDLIPDRRHESENIAPSTRPRKRMRTSSISERPSRIPRLATTPPFSPERRHSLLGTTNLPPLPASRALVAEGRSHPRRRSSMPSPLSENPRPIHAESVFISVLAQFSPLFQRKRPTAGEFQLLINLYRTVSYGLQYRVNRHDTCSEHRSGPDSSRDEGQERLLAQHLQAYLLFQGVDDEVLAVDLPSLNPNMSESMDLTEEGQSRVALPYHLYGWFEYALPSYSQLVATSIIRHRFQPKRNASRKPPRRPGQPISRPPSSLSKSIIYGTA